MLKKDDDDDDDLDIYWDHFVENGFAKFCQIPASMEAGSAITNGREARSCLGRVFNFKLGSFVSKKYNSMACTQPLLKLKTRPRFRPVS